jgi:hypothetical protein
MRLQKRDFSTVALSSSRVSYIYLRKYACKMWVGVGSQHSLLYYSNSPPHRLGANQELRNFRLAFDY